MRIHDSALRTLGRWQGCKVGHALNNPCTHRHNACLRLDPLRQAAAIALHPHALAGPNAHVVAAWLHPGERMLPAHAETTFRKAFRQVPPAEYAFMAL